MWGFQLGKGLTERVGGKKGGVCQVGACSDRKMCINFVSLNVRARDVKKNIKLKMLTVLLWQPLNQNTIILGSHDQGMIMSCMYHSSILTAAQESSRKYV